MTKHRRVSALAGVIASALLAITSASVVAQDEAQPMTVVEVDSDIVGGTVITIDGIALQPKFVPWDGAYFFSDGTGVIIIDPRDEIPLLTPINIVGHQVALDEVRVSSWTELDTPMEDLGPLQEAFLVWVALLADEDMGDDAAADDVEGDDD